MATVSKDFISRNGVQGTVLKSTISTGTAPLQVSSTTAVTNLNADLLDGNHAAAFALVGSPLSQFAATTSAQLAGVISDETGSDKLVFNTSPTLVTSLLTSSSSFDLLNTTATTLNIGGAATTLALGGTPTGSITFNIATNATATGNTKALNIGTAGASGSTTNIAIGSAVSGATSTVTLNGTLVGSSTTQAVFNTTATTVNAFGAATTLTLGAATGTATVANATVTLSNATTLNINGASPAISTSSTTASVFNATTTTLNIGGAATTLSIGAGTGTTTVNNNLTVGGNLVVNGTTTTVNSTVTTYDDPIITLGGDSAPGADDNKDRGVEFRWHNGSTAKVGFFGYDDSTGKFTFIADATNTSEVFSGTKGSIDAYHSGSDINSGTVSTSYGGTGLTSFTSGGAVYATSTSVLTTGTLPVTAGGTGVATLTAGYVKSNGTSAFTSVSSIPGSDVSGAIAGNAAGLAMTSGDVTSKTVTVSANSTPTNLDSFAVATSTTAKYLIQMKQGTKMTSTQLVVAYDGTDVQVSEFGVVDGSAGAANATITASYSAPNVLVTVSSSDAATTNVVCKAIVSYIDA